MVPQFQSLVQKLSGGSQNNAPATIKVDRNYLPYIAMVSDRATSDFKKEMNADAGDFYLSGSPNRLIASKSSPGQMVILNYLMMASENTLSDTKRYYEKVPEHQNNYNRLKKLVDNKNRVKGQYCGPNLFVYLPTENEFAQFHIGSLALLYPFGKITSGGSLSLPALVEISCVHVTKSENPFNSCSFKVLKTSCEPVSPETYAAVNFEKRFVEAHNKFFKEVPSEMYQIAG